MNGWGKWFISMAVAGLLGWGALKADVINLRRDVDQKANKETVDVQYNAILQRLDAIDRKLP